jgi:hypothetical protein
MNADGAVIVNAAAVAEITQLQGYLLICYDDEKYRQTYMIYLEFKF